MKWSAYSKRNFVVGAIAPAIRSILAGLEATPATGAMSLPARIMVSLYLFLKPCRYLCYWRMEQNALSKMPLWKGDEPSIMPEGNRGRRPDRYRAAIEDAPGDESIPGCGITLFGPRDGRELTVQATASTPPQTTRRTVLIRHYFND